MNRREYAETIGLQSLTWLVQDSELLGRFLAATGTDPAQMAELAQDAGFLGAVLDFLLTEDSLVLGFAEASGLAPEAVLQARASLPGGDVPHWT
ncbi:MAG: DUF3572 domain-containing protein [Gemmobacter sp.]|uniref:DUF3572 domain-containing protein n=1 Tax=Gemmobacter sp. TaxID=1898957 RepID=UPI001A37D9E1|nr:DUF3572 domain-containing protein [Gemmobacter sp.]MBL8562483.1 DUF3572 domain-containing protein [Gemmobacter sp.]